jgi:hypothetical protein
LSTDAVTAGAPSKQKSPKQRQASKRLAKHIQAGQFLMKFAKWQSKMQKKLRTETSAHNTLVALQQWSGYVYFDDARSAVVCYVMKRLKQGMRSNSSSSEQEGEEQLLREWSTGIHREAQVATEKLAKVTHHIDATYC